MRISLLLQREPFGAILEQTLMTFLQRWRGEPHQVRWYAGRPNVEQIRRCGQQPWLCNIYLNAIFVPDADARIFDPIRREFSHSRVWWRRPAQRAYVELGVSPLMARWLAQASVGIAPALPNAEQLLVVAGNHKIRLLDYAQDVCYGILKSGFPSTFMEREIAARQLAEKLGVPVPRLESVSEDGAWFRERYISGTPVNRLVDENKARQAVQDAVCALRRLYEYTMREESLDEYVENLVGRIRAHIAAHPTLDERYKQSLLCTVGSHRSSVIGHRSVGRGQEAVSGRQVITALTHGDFQPGNILVNADGVWLIDWEYSARRQVGYDALIYALRARSGEGLEQRLQAFRDGELSEETRALAKQLEIEWEDAAQRKIASYLFALEEMEVRVLEIRPQIVIAD